MRDDGITYRNDWTKMVVGFNLQKVGGAFTGKGIDLGNAENGIGGVIGAVGVADWNDTLFGITTSADFSALDGLYE